MNMGAIRRSKFLKIVVLGSLFSVAGISAQEVKKVNGDGKPEARLFQSGPYTTSELASLHIDMLRNEMHNHPQSKGVFVVYCGKICKYGEVEAHLRGLNLSLRGKGWKVSDFVLSHGGFKEKLAVEYWLVPENACFPKPASTIDIKDVKYTGRYRTTLVPYDCCD